MGNNAMSSTAYYGWLVAAIIADIFSVFLPVGPIFIAIARFAFLISGYGGGFVVQTLAAFIIEFIPIFSITPACTLFVWLFHKKNKKETAKKEQNIEIQKTL